MFEKLFLLSHYLQGLHNEYAVELGLNGESKPY